MREEIDEICLASVEAVSTIFGGKWAFMILGQLHKGPKRFNQISKELKINTKSLTDTLRRLEDNGIIIRKIYPTVPVTVEYSLTEKGRDFEDVLRAMKKWGEKWLQNSYNKRSRKFTPLNE